MSQSEQKRELLTGEENIQMAFTFLFLNKLNVSSQTKTSHESFGFLLIFFFFFLAQIAW